jgi:hypothetical protein
MPIFVALVLAPTLTFYLYALVQFWMEAHRRRADRANAVELHGSRLAGEHFDAFPRQQIERHAHPTLPPAPRGQNSRLGPHANVVAMRLRNRPVTIPSPAGRPAAQRAAKG